MCSFAVFNAENEFCGVIIYSSGANRNAASPFNLMQGEVAELVRVALNGKQESTSKALSISLKLLKKKCPLVKMVFSYSDLDQNHVGTLYQATNWIYLGLFEQGKKGTAKMLIKGKLMHMKSVYSKGWKQQIDWIKQNIDKNAELVYPTGKHKYLYIFDKELKKVWAEKSMPYPKKAIEV